MAVGASGALHRLTITQRTVLETGPIYIYTYCAPESLRLVSAQIVLHTSTLSKQIDFFVLGYVKGISGVLNNVFCPTMDLDEV